jgi:hypothetical protein
MEDVQVAAAAYYFITLLVRRVMCSRVARGGTRASFDAEQEGEDTVYTSRLEVARRMFGDVWR